jgi:hypothetical protein
MIFGDFGIITQMSSSFPTITTVFSTFFAITVFLLLTLVFPTLCKLVDSHYSSKLCNLCEKDKYK